MNLSYKDIKTYLLTKNPNEYLEVMAYETGIKFKKMPVFQDLYYSNEKDTYLHKTSNKLISANDFDLLARLNYMTYNEALIEKEQQVESINRDLDQLVLNNANEADEEDGFNDGSKQTNKLMDSLIEYAKELQQRPYFEDYGVLINDIFKEYNVIRNDDINPYENLIYTFNTISSDNQKMEYEDIDNLITFIKSLLCTGNLYLQHSIKDTLVDFIYYAEEKYTFLAEFILNSNYKVTQIVDFTKPTVTEVRDLETNEPVILDDLINLFDDIKLEIPSES